MFLPLLEFIFKNHKNYYSIFICRFMGTSIEQILFICLTGESGSGKSEICKDFAKVVAKPFCNFKCSDKVGYRTISTFLKVSYMYILSTFRRLFFTKSFTFFFFIFMTGLRTNGSLGVF